MDLTSGRFISTFCPGHLSSGRGVTHQAVFKSIFSGGGNMFDFEQFMFETVMWKLLASTLSYWTQNLEATKRWRKTSKSHCQIALEKIERGRQNELIISIYSI